MPPPPRNPTIFPGGNCITGTRCLPLVRGHQACGALRTCEASPVDWPLEARFNGHYLNLVGSRRESCSAGGGGFDRKCKIRCSFSMRHPLWAATTRTPLRLPRRKRGRRTARLCIAGHQWTGHRVWVRTVARIHFRMEQIAAVLPGCVMNAFNARQSRSDNASCVWAMKSQNQSAFRRSHSRSIGLKSGE